MEGEQTGRRLQTIDTAFAILEEIQRLNGARVAELANQMEMAESTIHGYLATLYHNGYLVKEGDVYHIGLQFLNLAGYARQRKREYAMARNKLKQLSNETNERVQFIVEEHGIGIYVHTVTGSQAVQVNARMGKHMHLHSSAAGKAILAHLSQPRVEQVIDQHGLPPKTDNTITDTDTLYEELETVREQGHSFNKQESTEGLRAIGVPVKQASDTVLGALSISGPSNRLQDKRFKEKIPNLLKGAANELELKIDYE